MMTPDRTRPLESAHHDLAKALEVVNEAYFDGSVQARICWGSWCQDAIDCDARVDFQARLILISPTLDAPFVPKYFLHWVVFHELLHLIHQSEGEVVIEGDYEHTAEFFHSEARYVHLARAKAWATNNAERMVRRAVRLWGKPCR